MQFPLGRLSIDRLVCIGVWLKMNSVGDALIIRIDFSGLRQSHWYEYTIRFVLGGLMTAVAGLISNLYGPVVGGLFLAFPAIFPASVTLIEEHEREGKERLGMRGSRRGKEAAALEATGAAIGSFGLASFGIVIWLTVAMSPWLALIFAGAAWLVVSVLLWSLWQFRTRRAPNRRS
jgi:hypothetical protein